ncbi:uncharacterized protein LOC114374958 [Glycine soja]|uniref:Knr4/Smi1-like domain-containing protein n=1 Tax=Glycine soja TaxID=3848 RepID=A0A445HX32_GLYSO|nr:uncharacterized protein LOC114374958 [Glycine soja]RZB78327.1 hypothetical protein D0Y65_028962 [Glycine soja]
MATGTVDNKAAKSKPPRPKRICFSFAAYAGDLLNCLKASKVAIDEGLSDAELSNIESKLKFSFPPDLRAILQQGLPVSQGFPNWRSSSTQQLQILLNLPASSILRRVSSMRFWHPSWGPEPSDPTRVIARLLHDAPPLVPIYRHCYIPSSPGAAGNPVFHVDNDGDVRLLSFDVAGFFREFLAPGTEEPVWAATAARRVRFWSEVADAQGGELGGCLERVVWKLREGGWTEEEIREMMTVEEKKKNKLKLKDKEALEWHVRALSLVLLRGGWSREDVVYSLGLVADQGKSWLEFHQDQHNLNINGF